ncbi:hypothetical protein V7S43_013139 [Phytophthora oleae]|uniref:Uncharacterized protein n=1 Tax=Phytophthora oleae TaxID=2107226 RepID=A0ABD3F4T1_9STRA
MVVSYTPHQIQDIKDYLGVLLDNSVSPPPPDYFAINAVFWAKLRALLDANQQSQCLEHLDTLVQAVLDNHPDAALGGTVFLLPPPPSNPAPDQSSSALALCPAAPNHNLSNKGKSSILKRSASSKATSKSTPKKARTSSPPSSSQLGKAVSPIHIIIASSCPKIVRTAITGVLAKAAAQNKKPWQLVYPWAGRRLWYDPSKWKNIYRAHWRLYREFRPLFWCWAFYARQEFNESSARFNLKSRAVHARLRFISLCIETWGYYSLCKRLDDNDDLFWYGGIPAKGSSQVRTDSKNTLKTSPRCTAPAGPATSL